MSYTSKDYLQNILVSLPENFTIQVGQYAAMNKQYLLTFLDKIKGLLQQSIDNAPVQSDKSGSDAAREKSYNEINQRALRTMMNTPVMQQDPTIMHVLSAYLEILNMQTGHVELSLAREQGVGPSRVFSERPTNKAFSSKRVQPGNGSPGCVLLSDLLTHKDQIHDAFDDNRNKQQAGEQNIAQKRVLKMIGNLKIRADEIRLSNSSIEEKMSLDTFDLFYEHFDAAVATDDPDDVITNRKVKDILHSVCESSKSILQYYSVVSFYKYHEDVGLAEQGIFISADRDKDAWMKCQEIYPHALHPLDRGASETFCLLQTQPIFLKKLQLIFRLAANNANKTVILSSFINQRHDVEKRADIVDQLTRLRSDAKRGSCDELDSFEIPPYGEYKSSLKVTDNLAKHAIQATYAAQQGSTTQSARERALEERFKVYKMAPGKFFPINCQVIQNGTPAIIHLDPMQLVFCETFVGVDMHSVQNQVGSSQHIRMAHYDLTMAFPPNQTTPLVGPGTGVANLMPATVAAADPAKDLFRGPIAMEEKQAAEAGLQLFRRGNRAGRGQGNMLVTSSKSVVSNQSEPTLPPVNITCQGTLQCAALGVYAQQSEFPKGTGTAMPRNVGLYLKENPTRGNMNTDFIPVFVGTDTANALTELMGVRKGGCGKEEFKNSTGMCASGAGCACMKFVEGEVTGQYQAYMDCWSQEHSGLSDKKKKDIKKAEISWCPCHGAYISNILAVIKDSRELHEILSHIAEAAGDLSILKSFVEREPNDIVGVKITIPKGKAENLIYAANPDRFGRGGRYARKEVGQFVIDEIVSTQLGDGMQGTWSFEDEKYYFTFRDHLNEQLKKSANGGDLVPLDGINISGPRLAGAWQGRLRASGTLPQEEEQDDGSFVSHWATAEKLEKMGENGLGICCTTCMCRGLCIGNQLWATLGIYTLIDIHSAYREDNQGGREFIRRHKQTIGLPIAALITCVTQMRDSGTNVTLEMCFQRLLNVSHPYLLASALPANIEVDSIWTFALAALLPLLESETNLQSMGETLRERVVAFEEKSTFTVVGEEDDRYVVRGKGFYGHPLKLKVGITELGRDDDEEYLYTVDGIKNNPKVIIPANILAEKTKQGEWREEANKLDKAINIHQQPVVDVIGPEMRQILGKGARTKREDLVTFTNNKFNDALRRGLSKIHFEGSYTSGNTDPVDFYMYTGHDVCNIETLEIMEQTICHTLGGQSCKKSSSNKRTRKTKSGKKKPSIELAPDTIWGLVNYIIYTLNETADFPKAIIAESNPAVVAVLRSIEPSRNPTSFNLSLDQWIKLNSLGASSLGPIIEIISSLRIPQGVDPDLWSVAGDLAIQCLLSIKTYGDLHQLLLSLQISQTDEFMPAIIAYMTGDYMGTAVAATFKDEQGNTPRICMTAKSTEQVKGKIPMHFLPMALWEQPSEKEKTQLGYLQGKRRQVKATGRGLAQRALDIRIPLPRVLRQSVFGTPRGGPPLHAKGALHPSQVAKGALHPSQVAKGALHPSQVLQGITESEEDDEEDSRTATFKNKKQKKTSEIDRIFNNDEMEEEDEEGDDGESDDGEGGKGLFSSALGRGGSKKRRHRRRRKTRRKKKRRKRKTIRKRRKRGRKTRRK